MTNIAQSQTLNGMDPLRETQRIVIKIGSSLLIDPEKGTLKTQWLETLIADIAALHSMGKHVLIVSSGAIGLGRRTLKLSDHGAITLSQKQAASAVGQIQLTQAYQTALSKHNIVAAQVLLTIEDSENRRRYINARNTLLTLLEKTAIPVINENDTVATSEIRVGDNDRLAARVAAMASADMLVLLSDIDGLYSSDPTQNTDADFIPLVREITPDIAGMAGVSRTDVGTGGMVTKLKAGRIANGAGCHMIITNGHTANPLQKLRSGGRHTLFEAHATPRAARKEWLASGLSSQGTITVDEGAIKALIKGSSLLPAGVTGVTGVFERGDAVTIIDQSGQSIGRGLSAYRAAELRKIQGAQSHEISDLIGYDGRPEAVHRDDLVLEDHVMDQMGVKI